jgi:glycosyltransferase involved in cell wall biosynthesis
MTAQPVRICFATTEYPPHQGGVARSARRIVHGLAAAGFDVTVFAALAGAPPGGALSADGPVAVQWTPPDLVAARRAIGAADRRRRFDVFHGFPLVAAWPCLTVAAIGARPVISSIRGADGVAFDAITTEVLRKSQWVTSVSGDSLVRARTITDLSARSSVIPNGIDVADFPAWSPNDANRGVVGTVATFRLKKNIPLLIRAYACLPRALRRALLLVGDGCDENGLPSAAVRRTLDGVIDDMRLRGEATITGMIEHRRLPEYHQRMRVFALSSDHEGLPNSILEAAASGLPIVSTAVDGVKDIFTDGVDALLVPPHDTTALSSALERVLNDDDLAARLSLASRRLAGRLTLAEEVRRYVALYDALLAGRTAAGIN